MQIEMTRDYGRTSEGTVRFSHGEKYEVNETKAAHLIACGAAKEAPAVEVKPVRRRSKKAETAAVDQSDAETR